MSPSTSTTRLLRSAARLYPNDFKDDVKERFEHPYKAPTPEFGIDIEEIRKEVEDSKVSYAGKSIFLFVVSVVALIAFFVDPEENVWILFLALFLTSTAELIYLQSAKKKVRNIMRAQATETETENEASADLSRQNVMISGGYSPFIGAGFDMDSWSFAVDLSKPEDKQSPIGKVRATELHNIIKDKLCTLDIEDMTIRDELFVNGQDVNFLPHLQPEGRMKKPTNVVDDKYVVSKINSNDRRERHYRAIQIPMWDGELVLSMYYRFLVVNDNLFTEARFFILPPIKKKYRDIGNLPSESTSREFFENYQKAVFTGIFSWIPTIVRAFFFVMGGFMAESATLKGWKKEVETNRLYNYGWETSLREKWASTSYERYFQQVDKDVSLKMITNEFLNALLDYLSENNISIEQFKQTSTKIINEGVMISGGEVKAETLAVGKGAQVAKTAINAVKGEGKSQ